MKKAESEQKRIGKGIIWQVAVLFAIGILAIGLLTFFTEQFLSTKTVKSQMSSLLSDLSNEVMMTVDEYPAADWLLNYWYEHDEDMDIEYDADYREGTETEKKCREFTKKHPDFQLEYASEEEIMALPEEDQELYAEIVYSWLITRINEIKRTYSISFLYCVLTDDTFSYQYFLFSAADEGAKRGTNYEEVYPIAHVVPVEEGELMDGMRIATEDPEGYLVRTGKYMDYYKYMCDVADQHALIGVSYDTSAMMARVNRQTYRDSANVVAGLLVLTIVYLLLLLIYVLRPLRKVQQNIRLYTKNKDRDMVTRNLRELGLTNEMGDLSNDIISLAEEIDHHVDEIATITAEKQRISAELDLASRIQKDMLPSVFPPYPERSDIDLYGDMIPAKEVGGDYFDFFKVDEDHLAMVMADVSGKGVPAALFMMITKIMIENAVTAGSTDSPAEILAKVNNQICKNNKEEMFVTMWLGILDFRTGHVSAANAGHEYPIIKKPKGSFEIMKDKHGFVLGGMEDISYIGYEFTMEPDSKLFLYTDGVPEATNENNELFGMERTLKVLRDAENETPEEILGAVNAAINDFIGDAVRFDDVTMLCVHYIGRQDS
ncbi:MAG: PP2C family protein-serine/threonine phosphatase [Bacillota bacterium]